MKPILTRLAGFGSVPIISAVVPFIVLPIAARVDGAAGWAAIGTGQAIGSFVAMISSYGWNVSGGARIAGAGSESAQREIYAQALWSRLIIFLAAGAVGAIASALLVGGTYAPVAAIATLATGATGLTLVWFAVGMGDSRIAVLYEAVPFATFTLIGAGAMILTSSVVWYPVFMLAGSFLGLAILNLRLYGSIVMPWSRARVAQALRANAALAFAEGIGGSYTTAPVPIAQGLVSTQAAAQLTSADKVYRIGLSAIVVLGNSMQKWVLEITYASGRLRRHLIALAAHGVVGLIGFVVLAFLGQPLTQFLLGAAVTPPAEVFPLYGIAYFIISLTTPLIRNVLVPAGKDRFVLSAILTSAVIGLPAMIAGALSNGILGIVTGLVVSEVIVILFVATASVFTLRREVRSTESERPPRDESAPTDEPGSH